MIRLTDTSRDSRNSNAVRIYCDEQTALKRLYEYENINLTPHEIEEMRADAHSLHNENNKLKKELEVYKKALKSACEWIDNSSWSITDGTAEDWERAKQTTNDFYLEEARKELEDEIHSEC